ncbi:arylsulfate sulfotransferase [Acidisarcina polymorpha]|uniref:Arylsulfate sulfotransferase n=2 Tax=Acidisarcina polymorpha TaxID=2211140 RepID=A0A2Z5G243_9BACT|nr:arylsulfate sulfotransferase [Acidisarcina polymorpha]
MLVGCSSSRGSMTMESTSVQPGNVSATGNPLVASYEFTPNRAAQVSVQFGTDTSYGLSTSSQQTTENGNSVVILVAGMIANTTYHMRAVAQFADGTTENDYDHTFTTGSLPSGLIPSSTVTPTSGMTPQPGIELVDMIGGETQSLAFATDLQGNTIWEYPFPDRQPASILYPIRLLPNGNFICMIAPASQSSVGGPTPAGTLNVIREFDLSGTTIQQLTMDDLNTRMAAAGFNVTLQLFSHDIVQLPNGHLLVIANTIKPFTNLPGYPGVTNVVGDVVIDLDSNWQPVWYWNEFDHLDVNRHPMSFPDWTHTNSVTYSPDDGNFIVSIRHQNWIVKVDYRDGAGTGDIVWRLGEGGDFALQGATDPTDWFYAQHNAIFTSPNSTGSFQLAIMDNGNDRLFPQGVTCGNTDSPACLYSTAMVMQVDEEAKTASFVFHYFPPNLYSGFAGDTAPQPNGNIESDFAGVGSDSYIQEVTPTSSPTIVWQMHITGSNSYRAYRMPSLYPGVQWQ